jgi:DNA polymerase III epsilon subunit-like protein
MARTDIMIDLETLATSPDAAILTIGAVRFDPFSDGVGDSEKEQFYAKVDLDSCNDINLTVSDDTINWWATQSEEAREEAFSQTGRIRIEDAFADLYKFCWGAERVWSNGAAFDIVICETVFNRIHKKIPWNFWQVRDVRTMFDLSIDPKRPKVTAHNALADAVAQAQGVQKVCNTLKLNGFTPFTKY